jgi:hypothetical protein
MPCSCYLQDATYPSLIKLWDGLSGPDGAALPRTVWFCPRMGLIYFWSVEDIQIEKRAHFSQCPNLSQWVIPWKKICRIVLRGFMQNRARTENMCKKTSARQKQDRIGGGYIASRRVSYILFSLSARIWNLRLEYPTEDIFLSLSARICDLRLKDPTGDVADGQRRRMWEV